MDRYKRYRQSPKGKYARHKMNSANRGVPFNLSFEQWWTIWMQSGKWHLRGNRKGQYVMARTADRGAYEIGNVRIEKHEGNVAERNRTVADRIKQGLKITKTTLSDEAPF